MFSVMHILEQESDADRLRAVIKIKDKGQS